MSLDELRALDVSGVVRMIAAGHTLDHDEEYDVVRALVVAWPGLLGRVAAAEAERDALAKQLDEALSANHDGGYAIIGLQAERDALREAGREYLAAFDAVATRSVLSEAEADRVEDAREAIRRAVLVAAVPSGPAAGPTTSKETR